MKYFEIENSSKLKGSISVENSKNAILPILAATVLIEDEVIIKDVPNFTDIYVVIDILSQLGKSVEFEGANLIVKGHLNCFKIPQNLCEKLRASIFFLGSIIAVQKKCLLYSPGGCNLGARPIDFHINCMKSFGAKLEQNCEELFFDGTNMKNATINLPFASVGATINSIFASVFLKGESLIVNAAKEPEIVDLCNFLNKCGAKVFGAGSSVIKIVGVQKLNGCEYLPIPDRIVGATYLLMGVATRSNIEICNFRATHNLPLLKKLLNCGCSYSKKCDTIYLKVPHALKSFNKVVANVYPCFPTDLQPIMLACALTLSESSIITDNVFRDRFNLVTELKKMNAKVDVFGNSALINPSKLIGANVYSTDLRAGASLVLAGLVAKGTTKVYNIEYINRGYENIVEKLQNIGANITEKEDE